MAGKYNLHAELNYGNRWEWQLRWKHSQLIYDTYREMMEGNAVEMQPHEEGWVSGGWMNIRRHANARRRIQRAENCYVERIRKWDLNQTIFPLPASTPHLWYTDKVEPVESTSGWFAIVWIVWIWLKQTFKCDSRDQPARCWLTCKGLRVIGWNLSCRLIIIIIIEIHFKPTF